MSYRVSEEKMVFIDREGIPNIEAVIFASSSEDLPAYNAVSNRVLVPGSLAIIPSESKVYALDLDNDWKEWGAEEGDGTRSLSVTPGNLTKLAGTDDRDLEPEEELTEEPTEEVKKDEPSKKYFDFE